MPKPRTSPSLPRRDLIGQRHLRSGRRRDSRRQRMHRRQLSGRIHGHPDRADVKLVAGCGAGRGDHQLGRLGDQIWRHRHGETQGAETDRVRQYLRRRGRRAPKRKSHAARARSTSGFRSRRGISGGLLTHPRPVCGSSGPGDVLGKVAGDPPLNAPTLFETEPGKYRAAVTATVSPTSTGTASATKPRTNAHRAR